MKIIKKYTAVKVQPKTIDNNVEASLIYGRIEGPYYSQTHPKEIFDTEEEAVSYCYKNSPHSNWLILPVVSFDIYDSE